MALYVIMVKEGSPWSHHFMTAGATYYSVRLNGRLTRFETLANEQEALDMIAAFKEDGWTAQSSLSQTLAEKSVAALAAVAASMSSGLQTVRGAGSSKSAPRAPGKEK